MAAWVQRTATAVAGLLLAVVPVSPGESRVPVTGLRPTSLGGDPVVLRVNQQGWLPRESKHVFLMASTTLGATTYRVVDEDGGVALRGRVGSTPGARWSAAYPAVYRLDISALRQRGRYRVETHGSADVTSPWFEVAGARRLFAPMVEHGIAFDQNQRDGDEMVPGPLHRRRSHLNDARADVFAWPHMVPGEDVITDRDLTRVAGPVDVEGGWADAGDYLKFTHSAAYNDVVLFTSARLLRNEAPASLLAEARHGLAWLDKMDDEQTGTLHLQVGIGSGNKQGTFAGDHDLWRLPQADDHDTDRQHRYVAHRPVFDAAPAGRPVSPNLAGRVSAAFALAAQAAAATHPARALGELRAAQALYARADTGSPPRPLVTALPHAFYPEAVWQDDMELGATEIARAADALGEPAATYLADASRWATAYLESDSTDTLNLYDVGALAHASLVDAMAEIPYDGPPLVTRERLLGDMAAQVEQGIEHANHDPFGAAVDVTEFDANSHTFGLIATVALLDLSRGGSRFQAFAGDQRAWLLGGNPWGISAMVGIGSSYPRCMQHQVANLSSAPDLGAVVNGPNGADSFDGGLGGFQDGMRSCTRPRYRAFDGRGSRYVDDVRAWQTDEPALDMTAAAILAAAAQLAREVAR